MKKILFTIAVLLLLCIPISVSKQAGKQYVIGFYNVENLFDTIDDPHTNDAQFLPDGDNHWTEDKYEKKLHNIACAIKAIADENGAFHSVLGVAEVENRKVLEDLVAQPELRKARFQIAHHESPDSRGIDVAFLYRPDRFTLLETEYVRFNFVKSRDVFVMRGKLDGEMFAFMVAHLPSRLGDKGADERIWGAEAIHKKAAELMNKYPGIKIVVMGDMNDDPIDESLVKGLHAKERATELEDADFFSPFMSMLRAGYGSNEYRGTWEIFDQILVNKALLSGDGLRIQVIEDNKFYGKVFKPDFLIQQSGKYKGTPFRTFSNGEFINGYSDHLPTYIILK